MSASPTLPPELIQAHKLLKAAERGEAAKVLKAYLSKNPRDARAWWLMAHAVTRPDNVQMCLEHVLAINPEHAKARARLDELLGPLDDEPDDSFFGVSSAGAEGQVSAPTTPAPAGPHLFLTTPLPGMATGPEPSPRAAPVAQDPFAAEPPGPNPFTAGIAQADELPSPGVDMPRTTPEALPSRRASEWTSSFTEDEAPSVPGTPTPDEPPVQASPASPNGVQSPFLTGADDAGWFSQLDGAAFENPFAPAPSKPAFDLPDVGIEDAAASGSNTPTWLAQFEASDLHASLASAPASGPFAAADTWPAPEENSPPPAATPNPSLAAAPVPDPFAPSGPAAPAPEALDPFVGAAGPDDPFTDLPPDSSFSFEGSIGALHSPAAEAKALAAPPQDANKRVRRVLLIALLAIGAVLAAAGVWVVADQPGLFDPPPTMIRLDAASFTVEYSVGWMTVSMTGPLKAELPTGVIETMIQPIHIKPAGQ